MAKIELKVLSAEYALANAVQVKCEHILEALYGCYRREVIYLDNLKDIKESVDSIATLIRTLEKKAK